jgi:LacI family transcriptional regulator
MLYRLIGPRRDRGKNAKLQYVPDVVYSSLMTVRMKDIADALGLAMVTVSKALHDYPDISKETRERVKAKAHELGYRPNLTARSLSTGRSLLVGLIVPDLMNPFFCEIAKGLSTALRKAGYFVVISSSEEDGLLEQQEIDNILAHRIDALVVASCQINPESFHGIRLGNTPLIFIDRAFQGIAAHFVGCDDYAAGKTAAEHLLSIKCRRIAHICETQHSTGVRRLKGFMDTMKKHDIHVPAEYIVQVASADVEGRRHGTEALKSLMSLRRPPDGIFCFNDVIATGVVGEAIQRGIRIPDALAIVGCGNFLFDDLLQVPLSTVDQRSVEIGTRTGQLILELIAQKHESPASFRKIVLQPRLIRRASTERSSSRPLTKK